MRKLVHLSAHLCIAIVLAAVTAIGCAVETRGQSSRPVSSAMEPADCIERIDPINNDGSLLKPRSLLVLEQRHADAPSDPTVAKELTLELYDLAQHMMYCSPVEPKRKYPLAYCLYGRVLELDDSHKAALDSREMIESIYKSLGKSLPNCDCQ